MTDNNTSAKATTPSTSAGTPKRRERIPLVPVDSEGNVIQEVSLYEAHKKIYPKSVAGLFATWRWVFVWLTQILYYGLPWLDWGQRQAVLFDLGSRRFYIFGLVLYPQDFIYLTGLLVISAFSLFLFTAVAGRLWCGYTCPQTVYTEIFMWVEKQFEGDRAARMRLDAAPWSLNKIGRKSGKQIIWLLIALITGFTFVGYFTPIKQLAQDIFGGNISGWGVFWVFFYGFMTYLFAGYMREQVCKYMCPYARFQSAMFDKDTLIVTYDEARGEPRGTRKKGADPAALGLGACVDCNLCVQVCPVGIDIRKGLQYECIGCGACADVCDTVMDKVGYAKGLIKYSTENAVQQAWTPNQTWRRVLRPRVLIYSVALLLVTGLVLGSLLTRTLFKVDVVRDRASLARIVPGGKLENVYRVQIMNATEQTQRFTMVASGLPDIMVEHDGDLMLVPAEARWFPVRVRVPYDAAKGGSHPISLTIASPSLGDEVVEEAVFIVPR